jgi:hypothetical protein
MTLNPSLLAQLYSQESSDPFLMLVTISHPDDPTIYRFVNNTEDITSNSEVFTALPMKIVMPSDDGETQRKASIEIDNVALTLIPILRTVTTPLDCKIEMILASSPDIIEISIEDLKLRSISYDEKRIRAELAMDNFLSTEMTSEKYTPSIYPGLF